MDDRRFRLSTGRLLLLALFIVAGPAMAEIDGPTQFEIRKEPEGDKIRYNVYCRQGDSPWEFMLTRFTREEENLNKPTTIQFLKVEKGIVKGNALGMLFTTNGSGSQYEVFYRGKNRKWKFKNSIQVIAGPVGYNPFKTKTKVVKIIFDHPFLMQINWGKYSKKTGKLRKRSSTVFRYIPEKNRFLELHYKGSWKIRRFIQAPRIQEPGQLPN